MTERPTHPRGWVSIYAISFILLLGSGIAFAFAARGLLESTRLMWTSTILSGLAIVLSILTVVLPRR